MLQSLELIAFGPFTDVALELGADPRLHVVHGRNEAGKSTALRAISALFFGFEERTRDDHLHRKADLRVGARLLAPGGRALHVVRRKGRRHTLLDASGQPIDESYLCDLLAGLTPQLFAAMHGLDPVRLRQGGDELLRAGGDVGESLFDAGVGGRGVHALLRRLDAEAAELFAPRGRNPKLNAALAAYRAARQALATQELSAHAWQQQEQALAEARQRVIQLQREHREAASEHARLSRVARTLPALGKLREARERRAELEGVVLLPADASEKRRQIQQALSAAEREASRLEEQISELEGRREGLEVDDALASIDPDVLFALQERLGRHRAAATELPGRRAERESLRERAARTLRTVAPDVALRDAESLRPDEALKARIRALARDRSGLREAFEQAQRALRDAERQRDDDERRLQESPDPPEPGALRAAVARARALGDAEGRGSELARAVHGTELESRAALAELRPWSGEASRVVELRAPAPETVERFARAALELDARERRLAERLEEALERGRDLERQLRELEEGGRVPSELGLQEARRERDRLWVQIRLNLLEDHRPADVALSIDAYETARRRADERADQLRSDADRVALAGRLVHERTEAQRAAARAEREAAVLSEQRERHTAAWIECWRETELVPESPEEMGAWLGRLRRAREIAVRLERARAERDAWRTRVERAAAELAAALECAPEPLARLLERGEARLEQIAQQRRERAQRREALDAARKSADGLRERAGRCQRRLDAWAGSWAASARSLRLAPDAVPEEAEAVLDQLDQLFEELAEAARLGQRIEGAERDRALFARDTDRLIAQHAPELAALELDERARELLERSRTAQKNAALRAQLDEQIGAQRARLDGLRDEVAEASALLAQRMSAAHASNPEELQRAENASARALALDEEIRSLEQTLLEHGESRTLAELEREAAELDSSELRGLRAELESRLEERSEQLDRAKNEVWNLEAGLERLREQNAVAASENAAAELSRVRELAERTARLRLGGAVLRREIERYRQEHQGPVLARARTLFPRLTRGEWSGLRVGFSDADEPVLSCVRPDGTELGVEALSDGTRDQLYLALRLATLLHRAAVAPALPLVLDDVLIHFDDDRARAALEVLGEVATQVQVLLFTHHPSVVELAREAVPSSRRAEHDLDALRGRAPARDALSSPGPAQSRPLAPS